MELITYSNELQDIKEKFIAKSPVTGRAITDDDIQRFEKNRSETKRRKEAGEDVSWNAYRERFMSL